MLRNFSVRRSTRDPRGFARASQLLCFSACALALAGCGTIHAPNWSGDSGAAYQPSNYTDIGPIPADVRRVAVLAMHSDEWRGSELAPIDAAFVAELEKFDRFEVVPISREDLRARFGQETLLSSAPLPAELFARLHADFAADAVLFIDLTHYSPYQPIAMGVRARLVTAADAKTLWSFDALFDAAQPDVAVAARRYQTEFSRPAYPLEDTSGILQSPARFAKYVAHAVFTTLPKRDAKNLARSP